jgi:hypothetical protein
MIKLLAEPRLAFGGKNEKNNPPTEESMAFILYIYLRVVDCWTDYSA